MSAHFFDRCLVVCVAILLPAFAALPAKAERVRCENAFLTDEADSQPRADIDQLLRQLIRALEPKSGVTAADLNELLNQLLNELQKQMPSRDNDARYGADPAVFTQSLTDLFQIYGATLLTRRKPTLDLMLEASRTDSIMLISANLFDAANSSVRPDVHGRHALLVLKLFPETSEIVIFDPNNPNDIYRTRYTARSDGSIQFNTRLNYTAGGTIAIPYSVEIVQRPLGH